MSFRNLDQRQVTIVNEKIFHTLKQSIEQIHFTCL